MSTIPATNQKSIDQLLDQLQALYRRRMRQDRSSRIDYYRQRIVIIEQARIRLSLDNDCFFSVLDEFLPEYQIMYQTVHHRSPLVRDIIVDA